jgi:hypothetical protein
MDKKPMEIPKDSIRNLREFVEVCEEREQARVLYDQMMNVVHNLAKKHNFNFQSRSSHQRRKVA